jgi:hypothetical protein
MTKVTFTLDDETVEAIRTLAAKKKKPRSLVVREAVAVYARQDEKLDDDERLRRLRVLDSLRKLGPTRPQADVDRELRAIRAARRTGWRRTSD